MIIETENSTYEIEGDRIRKIAGEPSDKHDVADDWVTFKWLHWKAEVGQRLMVAIGTDLLRTSYIKSIVVGAENEDDVPMAWEK